MVEPDRTVGGETHPSPPLIKIVSGLSGAGKTVALRALEDAGYTCIDNLPPQLIDAVAATMAGQEHGARVAIGIDVRGREFLPRIVRELPALRQRYPIEIVFLEAEADILVRRFKETRRPHPLVSPEVAELDRAIALEKGLLLPLREAADTIIDTSPFTPHQLREHMLARFRGEGHGAGLSVTVMSFGYKFGIPRAADLLFDVRFLPNPHFIPELRDLTGIDIPVSTFVMEKPQTREFLDRLGDFLAFLLPLYEKEGKAYLTIGIGCTGGRHRSIAIAEDLAVRLRGGGRNVAVLHRDL
jgi:UPF0042 nucleotide-binding protein